MDQHRFSLRSTGIAATRRLAFLLRSRKSQTSKVAVVCKKWLNHLGVTVKNEVFEVQSNKRRRVYLVCLHMPGEAGLYPDDLLCLRLFLTRKVEFEYGLPPKSIRIIIHSNTEARRLSSSARSVTSEFLKQRIALYNNFESIPDLESKASESSVPHYVAQEMAEIDQLQSITDRSIDVSEATFTDFGRISAN